MAPAVTIDTSSDFAMPTPQNSAPISQRTLLLAPPSVSSHQESLEKIFESHDRSATDIQMLDRLAMGFVSLPPSTYDLVLLLTDVDGTRTESGRLLDRSAMSKLVQALKAGGRLRSQDGGFGSTGAEKTEAILAGLIDDGQEGMSKPAAAAAQTVSLSLKRKKADAAAVPANAIEAENKASLSNTSSAGPARSNGGIISLPAGVGMSDDLDEDMDYEDDDEFDIPSKEELLAGDSIDPDTLLTEADRQKPVIIPEACKPNGKRRRACKDCTCGLKQKIDAEDAAKRSNADQQLQTMKLGAEDLNEMDFTVQGKVGSCGNCALGDAFRCDGCPYIGLPAFKPGEEVRLLNNDIQL